ncbi:nucleoporin NUP42-like isoform X2 [Gallus gallus]|uniref:nucleoporin NUP42-like isoform X2 n=1 Tax=Gallus gallus TaxID=9031 RepID=UPI001AE28E5F|nr:nucleoporin NUP42-like isoform X2 [Gallus gallus]
MFQHTAAGGGGAGGGMGTTTQTNTNIIQPAVFQHTAGGGGGSGAPAAVTQPPVIANSTSGGSGDGGGLSGASGFGPAGNNGAVLSQNAFSALSSAQPADGQRDGQQSLLDVIAEDMATWESSGQWMFSCYSPETGKPNVPGFGEFSAEEVRLEYYNCSANNNTGYYINSVNQLVQQWRKRLQELKALNGSGKAAMQSPTKNAVTQPLPSLGFAGQQAPSTGFPGFPVSSSSGAASFSFKANPSVPPGNAAAVGSSAAASNPPTLGVTSSPSVPNPVGSGNSSAPSAAPSSLNAPGATGGCGTSGLSGSGSSAAANSSCTALLPGSSAAANSSSTAPLPGSSAAANSSSTALLPGSSAAANSSSTAPLPWSSAAANSSSTALLPGSSAAANSSSTAPLPVSAIPSAATGTSQSGASSASAAQTAGASGHNVTPAPSAVRDGIRPDRLYTPRSELTAEELRQFAAKRFTLGKIPLKPPPADMLHGSDSSLF